MRPGELLVLKLKNELADLGAPAAAGGRRCRTACAWHAARSARGAGSLHERLDVAHLDEPAFSRPDRAAGLSPGRGAQDLDRGRRAALRISIPDSGATSRRAFTGITRTFTASPRRRCSAALPARSSSRASSAPIRHSPGWPQRVLVIRDQNLLNPERAALEDRAGGAEDAHRSRRRLGQQRHRLRQARQGSVDQFRARAVSRLSAGRDRDAARRAAAVARGERLRHHLLESRRALSAHRRRSSASSRSTACR